MRGTTTPEPAPPERPLEARVTCSHELFMEIVTGSRDVPVPLHRERIGGDLGDLVDEAFVSAVLSDELPPGTSRLEVEISPVSSRPPLVDGLAVCLHPAPHTGPPIERTFRSGRWVRRAQGVVSELLHAEALGSEEAVYVAVYAEPSGSPASVPVPRLIPPAISPGSLSELGVGTLGTGELRPDRPVLVSERMVDEVIRLTEEAGASEAGGSTLGRMLRLDEPLPGTTTRVVTVLTESISDTRHVGELTRFTFDPQALQEASRVARLRGMGEAVLTAFHSHGWGRECGRCNQTESCALPQATLVSLDDYRVLESLFPSKASLMPIAGRKLGTAGTRPVLEVHAWCGGTMLPIPWRTYAD